MIVISECDINKTLVVVNCYKYILMTHTHTHTHTSFYHKTHSFLLQRK